MLCDPFYLHCIKSDKKRHRFLEKLTDEEVDCYYWKDENGASYSDLEKGAIKRAIVHTIKSRAKKKV